MNNEVYEELKRLINCFPEAYINRQLEFILIPKTNTYFRLRIIQGTTTMMIIRSLNLLDFLGTLS